MSDPILKDLPDLIKANILTPETAGQIEAFYRAKNTGNGESSGKFTTILGILGSLLAGMGIILLIAHNWEDLGRPIQTMLAFLPLAVGQGLCFYTLFHQKDKIVWREGSAVILFFAVASCISLISQIYHIGGSLSNFILVWMLLSVPLVYILPSSTVSLLYLAGITWYAILKGYTFSGYSAPPYLYLGLLVLIIPHYFRYWKSDRTNNFFLLHNWVLTLSFCLVLGAFAESVWDFAKWIFAGYLALFCTLYLSGRTEPFRDKRLPANPARVIGAIGILAILFTWSSNGLWGEALSWKTTDTNFFRSPFGLLGICLSLLVAWLFIRSAGKKDGRSTEPAGLSVYVFLLAILLSSVIRANAGPILINLWLLWIAIYLIRQGTIRDHLGILNFGLLIVVILAILRFFDDNIPFLWRGLFFLSTGLGFFLANYRLIRNRKKLS